MPSSVTMVIFKLSLLVSTSSHSSPCVILFICFTKSSSEQFFIITSTGFSSLQIYLMSMSLSYTVTLIKLWQISMFLVRIPTCLFFPRKFSPFLYSYTTDDLYTSVILSGNMLTNFTSCAHADSDTYSAYASKCGHGIAGWRIFAHGIAHWENYVNVRYNATRTRS